MEQPIQKLATYLKAHVSRECIIRILTLKQISEKIRKGKFYLSFIDLQPVDDSFNKQALWQDLMIYGVGDQLLNGIKIMYIDGQAYVRINGVQSE